MTLIASPHSQSMFADGQLACAAISTVFALTVNFDVCPVERIPWEIMASTGAVVWRLWRQKNTSGYRLCEPYELLANIPEFRSVSYDIITGYVDDDMVDAVARNSEADDAALLFRETTATTHDTGGTSMMKLGDAFERCILPGNGGVIVCQALAIGLWRSRVNPNIYYVFDSHTAHVAANGVRRARVFRFESGAQLLQWYLNDICDVISLDAERPADRNTSLEHYDPNTLAKFMYSLTAFHTTGVTGIDDSAGAAASNVQPTCAEMAADTRLYGSASVRHACATVARAPDTVEDMSECSSSSSIADAAVAAAIARVNRRTSVGVPIARLVQCSPTAADGASASNASSVIRSSGYHPSSWSEWSSAVGATAQRKSSSNTTAVGSNGTATASTTSGKRWTPYNSSTRLGLCNTSSGGSSNGSPGYGKPGRGPYGSLWK